MSFIFDNIIIGAGISGLCLGQGLQRLQKNFLVLEKSKSVGGRLATRRDGAATYDHGAQFVKLAHGASFFADDIWMRAGLKNLWFEDSKYQYFSSQKGMTSLAKAMALDLPIQCSEKVLQIQKMQSGWQLACESGQVFESKNIFLTAPVPQSLELLKNSKIDFPQELLAVTYAKAVVGLFEVEEHQELSKLTYLQNCNDFIFSVANQRSKKISENLAFTVVMQADYSAQNFERPESEILEDITMHFKKYLRAAVSIKKSQLKKWRYSHPLNISENLFLSLKSAPGIYLLGDGFGGPQILGACNSATSVLQFLSPQI